MNATPAPYRFHAFEVSYFSAKVRPALRYKQLWVEELRADYGEIQRRTGLSFIPVLVTPDDETWQDSTEILEQLEARHPDPPLFPSTPAQRMAACLVNFYVDEFALVPAMHTRWGTPRSENATRARFAAMTGNEEFAKTGGDRMMAARFAVGAVPEAAEAIEAHLRDLLDALEAHFAEEPYLLGSRQSFADCALMGPMDGHLFTDLVSRELLLETAWRSVGWIERCRFPNTDQQGEWLADDALAPTLREVLGVMARDAVPVVLDTLEVLEAWAEEAAPRDQPFPRAAGRVETQLRGLPMPRAAIPYGLLSAQRVADAYRALDAAGRSRVDEVLAGTGWEPLLRRPLRHRVRKSGFRLVFDDEAPAIDPQRR